MTLSPIHTERTLMSPPAVAGLLVTLLGLLDVKNGASRPSPPPLPLPFPLLPGLTPPLPPPLPGLAVLLKDSHYMLYHLALAMYPRILSTFDEELKPLSISVRVGQAVDVVGQAGKCGAGSQRTVAQAGAPDGLALPR